MQNKDNDSLINEILNGLDAINQETSSQDEYNEPSEIAPQDEFGTSIDEKNYDGALHNEEEIYPEEQPVIRKAPSGENISSMRPSAQGAKKKKKKKKAEKQTSWCSYTHHLHFRSIYLSFTRNYSLR